MPRSNATCHTDRPMHAHGLCRLCYREQRKATRAAAKAAAPSAAPVAPTTAKSSTPRLSAKARATSQPTVIEASTFGVPSPAPKPGKGTKKSPKGGKVVVEPQRDVVVIDAQEAEIVDAEVAAPTASFQSA
jgi:hypothetical protein